MDTGDENGRADRVRRVVETQFSWALNQKEEELALLDQRILEVRHGHLHTIWILIDGYSNITQLEHNM